MVQIFAKSGPKGSKNGSKNGPKMVKKRSKKGHKWSKYVPKAVQNGPKMVPKTVQKTVNKWSKKLSKYVPKTLQKWQKKRSKIWRQICFTISTECSIRRFGNFRYLKENSISSEEKKIKTFSRSTKSADYLQILLDQTAKKR